MIEYVLNTVKEAQIENVNIVIGYGKEQVRDAVNAWNSEKGGLNLSYTIQEEQLGTGHAVMMASPHINHESDYLLVLLGDVPFIKKSTILKAWNYVKEVNAGAVVLTMMLENPTGYGRIIKDDKNLLKSIKEEKDATSEEKKIKEVNTGIFIFNNKKLWENISKLKNNNNQKEYYLTDMVEIFNQNNIKTCSFLCEDARELMGINSVEQLKEMEQIFLPTL